MQLLFRKKSWILSDNIQLKEGALSDINKSRNGPFAGDLSDINKSSNGPFSGGSSGYK